MKRFLAHFTACLWMAAAWSAVLCTPGLEIYFNNPGQFNIGPAFAIALFAAAMLAGTALFALLLAPFQAKSPSACQALAFAGCCDSLLQYHLWANFFRFFEEPSSIIGPVLLLSSVHLILLALPFIVAWRLRARLAPRACKLALVLLLTQAVVLGNALAHYHEPTYDFKEYAFSETEKFTFGQQENIIILVVDCMGEGICKEVLDKFPELKDSLRDFTCFDRMTSPLPWTMYAVPAMLTGIDFPRKAPREPADASHDIVSRHTFLFSYKI